MTENYLTNPLSTMVLRDLVQKRELIRAYSKDKAAEQSFCPLKEPKGEVFIN